MNKKNLYYYPALCYIVLLMFIWLLSWLSGISQFVDDSYAVNSLLTEEGIRWVVRNSSQAVEAAPWGSAMLLVFIFALLYSSGMMQLSGNLFSRRSLTVNQRRAGLAALSILLLYVVLLFMCTVAPWHLLMGVTADISSSPLSKGWLLLVFLCVLFVSSIYGYVYGNFRSLMDIMQGVVSVASLFMPAFLAMLPAVALSSCVRYMGLFPILGVDDALTLYIEYFICFLPFVYVAGLIILDRK